MSDLEMLFIYSPVIADYSIREKKIMGNEGYIRIKAQLSNGDIFEAFEFVSLVEGKIKVLTYRLQWQTADVVLKKRWDNAEHHKQVATFPYHIHDGLSDQILESEPMSIRKALSIIESDIQEIECNSNNR
jgi:hypothetical protein